VSGGELTNGGPNSTAAAITGQRGVYLFSGTLANYGLIKGTESGTSGLGSYFGVALLAGGKVENFGTIEGSGALADGVTLTNGGTVINGASGATTALISGDSDGIYVGNLAGTVTNYGTVTGTAGVGIYFKENSNNTVTNAGTIAGASGHDSVLFGGGNDLLILDPGAVFTGAADGGAGSNTLELASAASAGTITGIGTSLINFGTITIDPGAAWTFAGNNTIASGVTLNDDGMLTNTGTLTGVGTLTIDPGTMVNSGYLGLQVALQTGSTLDNTSTGTISVTSGSAVTGTGGAVSVVNAGTIESTNAGVYLKDGGSVANTGTAALISGGADGVLVTNAAGTVSNVGAIKASASGNGIDLNDGGSVANTGTAALIAGGVYGIKVTGATGSVSNSGTIEGAASGSVGVFLADGGSVANTGTAALISGYGNGIVVNGAAGTVSNAGTIEGTAGIGVEFIGTSNDTVTNSGTIAGGGGHDAVLLSGSNDRVVVDPGAVFVGTVDGGGGSTLELASASIGTISGIGTSFANFGAVTVDPGADWRLAGMNTLAGTIMSGGRLEVLSGATAAGTIDFAAASGSLLIDGTNLPTAPNSAIAATILGLAIGDTIDLANIAFDSSGSATLAAGNLLQISENGRTYDLKLNSSQNFAGDQFTISSDGRGGTNINEMAVAPPTPPAPTISPSTPGGTTADMIMQNTNSGDLEIYDIGGNAILAAFPIGQVGLEWQFLGLGTFNGSDASDMLIRDTNNGNIELFDIGNSQITNDIALGNIGLNWQVLGVGDFSRACPASSFSKSLASWRSCNWARRDRPERRLTMRPRFTAGRSSIASAQRWTFLYSCTAGTRPRRSLVLSPARRTTGKIAMSAIV
jgi:hypothetical protein